MHRFPSSGYWGGVKTRYFDAQHSYQELNTLVDEFIAEAKKMLSGKQKLALDLNFVEFLINALILAGDSDLQFANDAIAKIVALINAEKDIVYSQSEI